MPHRHWYVVLTAEGELGDGEIRVPANVQALIAARLDTLSPDRKALLHDAAVIGKVFWGGAVAAMGGVDEQTVRAGLHELVRKELVRAVRESSVKDQDEYAFWHALVRDVRPVSSMRGNCVSSFPPRCSVSGRRRQAKAWCGRLNRRAKRTPGDVGKPTV